MSHALLNFEMKRLEELVSPALLNPQKHFSDSYLLDARVDHLEEQVAAAKKAGEMSKEELGLLEDDLESAIEEQNDHENEYHEKTRLTPEGREQLEIVVKVAEQFGCELPVEVRELWAKTLEAEKPRTPMDHGVTAG